MNEKILIRALETIAQYDINSSYGEGICMYGCDSPYIAKAALENYKKASQSGVEADAENGDFCPACDVYSDCDYCADCGRKIRTA